MKREHALQARLQTLHTLSEAVTAMRSLSAHHLRVARAALVPAREYRSQLEQAVGAIGISTSGLPAGAAGYLVWGPELGLCGNFNARIVRYALDRRTPADLVYCVGRRARRSLERAGVRIHRAYPAATSTAGLPRLLLVLAQDILADLVNGLLATLNVISGRFAGVGSFSPGETPLLPLALAPAPQQNYATPYSRRAHLEAVAVRELLYSRLQQLALDGLAAEHGMRLVAAETARQWLEQSIETTRRQLATDRRESATQEVLELVAAGRNIGHATSENRGFGVRPRTSGD
jgi:F0F1-type ATP synthase gamma subunit